MQPERHRHRQRHPIARSGARLALCAAALWFAVPAWALHWPALHWPWHHHPSAGAQPVQVLAIDTSGAGMGQTAASAHPKIQQYWDRNTLLLDLTQVSDQGSARLVPLAGNAWPVRLEFRVRPGSIGRLEVQAAQRLIFNVPSQGAPVVLKVDPGVYQADTAQISLDWSRSQSE